MTIDILKGLEYSKRLPWGKKPALGQPAYAQMANIFLLMIIGILFKLKLDLYQTILWFVLINYLIECCLYDIYFR